MKLANKCDSTSNYIGQIEMGRRIPSFEKIEQFAAALKISPSMLFAEPENKDTKEKKDNTRDYLQKMPINVKKELQSRLFTQIKTNIMNSLDGNNY
ncbi:MAG: helix-turn-helix domain-containing protein [Treponema sp.]|nr:helix-turn-helix domain-containing protein [Treponema sp.]